MKDRISVLHVIDSMDAGGMERVALNLANSLPPDRYRAVLCATRQAGPLARSVEPHVRWLCLDRRHFADGRALLRMGRLLREEHIDIVHPHGSSLFFASAAMLWKRSARLLWHCHYGRFDLEAPPRWLYGPASAALDGMIVVNQPMADWARRVLRMRVERVWYVPNFVQTQAVADHRLELPGSPGRRIVCVANLRPQKDHSTLLRAMRRVIRKTPDAHLLLVGGCSAPDYAASLRAEAVALGVSKNVAWLGERSDVPLLLSQCDIGVLSSASEGLPLSLLEYGMAGLPAVATQVGQCAEVLDEGRAGLLLPPGDPEELATALVSLLQSPRLRQSYGARLRNRVSSEYDQTRTVNRICSIYDGLLG